MSRSCTIGVDEAAPEALIPLAHALLKETSPGDDAAHEEDTPMKTTTGTTTIAAPARTPLKIRTAVRAGFSWGCSNPCSGYLQRTFGDVVTNGDI